jgi:hypothetical protein
MFKPLEIVGDTAFRTTDQKVRGSNPFERAGVTFIVGLDAGQVPAKAGESYKARRATLFAMTPVVL